MKKLNFSLTNSPQIKDCHFGPDLAYLQRCWLMLFANVITSHQPKAQILYDIICYRIC